MLSGEALAVLTNRQTLKIWEITGNVRIKASLQWTDGISSCCLLPSTVGQPKKQKQKQDKKDLEDDKSCWVVIASRNKATLHVTDMNATNPSHVTYTIPNNFPLSAVILNPVYPSLVYGVQVYASRVFLFMFVCTIKYAVSPMISLLTIFSYDAVQKRFLKIDPGALPLPNSNSGSEVSLSINPQGTILAITIHTVQEPQDPNANSATRGITHTIIVNLLPLTYYRTLHPTIQIM